ncbi:carboxypeptidase regulatory-like domain-containing protein [Elusimicrobiota bacterium]
MDTLTSPDQDGTYTLTWSPVPGVSRYHIRESLTEDFTGEIISYETADPYLQITANPQDIYFYKVKAVFNIDDSHVTVSDWSNVISVWVLNDIDITFNSTLPEITCGTDMTITATTNPSEVDFYQWYLDEQALSGETDPSIIIGSRLHARFEPYLLSLKVSLGEVTTTESVTFKVILDAPLLDELASPDTDGNYQVDWTDINGASLYQLEESPDDSFYTVTQTWIADSSSGITGKADGTYFYRVKAWTEQADISSAWSNTVSVIVDIDVIQEKQYGAVAGLVTGAGIVTNTPLEGALIDIGSTSTYTDPDGSYYFKLSTGAYNMTVSYPGYITSSQSGIEVAEGSTSTVNIILQKSQTILIEPVLAYIPGPDTDGSYTPNWTSVDNAGTYQMQESTEASFSNASDTWTSDTFEAINGKTNGTYYYRVKAWTEQGGISSDWSNVVSVIVSHKEKPESIVKASVRSPRNSFSISGNRLIISAVLIEGRYSHVKSITFEYKSHSSVSWNKIPAQDKNYPNPDKTYPYFTYWDVTVLDEGLYNIRAVATDINGISDPDPGHITIMVDHNNPDIYEGDNEDDEYTKKDIIDNDSDNIIIIRRRSEKRWWTKWWNEWTTEILFPQGSLDSSMGTVTIVVDIDNKLPIPENLNDIGEFFAIELEGTQLKGEVTITVHYPDWDDDNIVDGTDIPVNTLCGFYFDLEKGKWEKLPTEVDTVCKVVRITASHFSRFAVFGAPAADLSDVKVYPNPYKPGKGHQWIKFDHITTDTKLRVYNISGEKVFEAADINTGQYIWNVKNDSGDNIASGVYICFISNRNGDKKTFKIAVIR